MDRRRVRTTIARLSRRVIRNLEGVALAIGGVEDHVHILASLRPKMAPADTIAKIKATSSKWVHEEWPQRRHFAWQSGYRVFSVSQSNLEDVKRYIECQKEDEAVLCRPFRATL